MKNNSFDSSPFKKFFDRIESAPTDRERKNLINQKPKQFLDYAVKECHFDIKSRNIEVNEDNQPWKSLRHFYSRTVVPFLKKKYGPMNTPFTSPQASRRRGNDLPTNISIGSATASSSITGATTLGGTDPEPLTQEAFNEVYKNTRNIKTELLPHLAGTYGIGRDLRSRTDAREHEDDLELIALGPRFSGRIVRKLGEWASDNEKLQQASTMLRTAHQMELLHMEEVRQDLEHQQQEYALWLASHNEKGPQIDDFERLVRTDASNQMALTRHAAEANGLPTVQQQQPTVQQQQQQQDDYDMHDL